METNGKQYKHFKTGIKWPLQDTPEINFILLEASKRYTRQSYVKLIREIKPGSLRLLSMKDTNGPTAKADKKYSDYRLHLS